MKNLDKFYYLSKFLEFIHADDSAIDKIILTKHSYLLISSESGEYLISTEQYVPGSFRHDYTKNTSSLDAICNKKSYHIKNISDMVGFRDFDIALEFCTKDTDCLCTAPDNKLIFSPQLTKYLLKHHFKIVDIKEKNDYSGEIIHVFLVEPGFYECIAKWKKSRDNQKKEE